jgi:hypothetical protein
MSNLAYTRPLGVWNVGVIRSTELQDLDRKTVKAPNFDGGGSYAPTSPIYVGGAGMQIKLVGLSTVDNAGGLRFQSATVGRFESGSLLETAVGSTASIDGQFYLSASSNSDFFGPITIRGESGLASLTVQAGVPVEIDGALTVGAGATAHFATGSATVFDGSLTLNNGALFGTGGAAAFTGLVALAGNTRIQAGTASLSIPMTCQFAGRVVKRPPVVVATTGSNITGYGPGNADTVIVRALTTPVAIYVQLGQNGDEFTVINKSSTNQMEVRDDNTGLPVFSMINRSGNFRSVTLVQAAGAWEVLRTEPGIGGSV